MSKSDSKMMDDGKMDGPVAEQQPGLMEAVLEH